MTGRTTTNLPERRHAARLFQIASENAKACGRQPRRGKPMLAVAESLEVAAGQKPRRAKKMTLPKNKT